MGRIVIPDSQQVLLLKAARAEAKNGNSHRGFRVGAAVWGYRPPRVKRPPEAWEIFAGANWKPEAGPTPKRCAEQAAIDAATSAGFPVILAIAIAGVPQPDDETGRAGKTLHPCGACRRMFLTHPGIRVCTRIFTIAHDPTWSLDAPERAQASVEAMTVVQLLRLHGNFPSCHK